MDDEEEEEEGQEEDDEANMEGWNVYKREASGRIRRRDSSFLSFTVHRILHCHTEVLPLLHLNLAYPTLHHL